MLGSAAQIKVGRRRRGSDIKSPAVKYTHKLNVHIRVCTGKDWLGAYMRLKYLSETQPYAHTNHHCNLRVQNQEEVQKYDWQNLFFKVWKQNGEQHETFYVAVYEKWLLLGKVTLLWNLPFMAIRCVTERTLWCGKTWCKGKRDLYSKHTHFSAALERVHRLKHTLTLKKITGARGRDGGLLANIFGFLVNILFDNTG